MKENTKKTCEGRKIENLVEQLAEICATSNNENVVLFRSRLLQKLSEQSWPEDKNCPVDFIVNARAFLKHRVKNDDYRGLSIELAGMDKAEVKWMRSFGNNKAELARFLTSVLGWEVDRQKLSHRMNDLDRFGKHYEVISLSCKFWINPEQNVTKSVTKADQRSS